MNARFIGTATTSQDSTSARNRLLSLGIGNCATRASDSLWVFGVILLAEAVIIEFDVRYEADFVDLVAW